MSYRRIIRSGFWAELLVVAAVCLGSVLIVSAQDDNTGSSAAPASRQPPIRHPAGAKLTEQEQRGGALFIQRCALCHLSKSFGTAGSKYCCVRSLGPSLNGMFKNMDPEQEQAMREIILNGGPTLMPGWKYGLEPKEIDDIIAYLKTLN